MKIVLIGADLEENLGIGMIGACLKAARHEVHVVPYDELGQVGDVVGRTLARRPSLVGLGVQFQHRAHDFLALARQLRHGGYRGHITCGGQFPTMAWREILCNHPEVDSIVLHDGEQTTVELCEALRRRQPLSEVAGLAIRGPGGPLRTRPRPLVDNLDQLPFPMRYRAPTLHLGVPFYPMTSGRGCWGSCAFCAITTFYRDAHRHGGGRKLRLRSPEHVATEMAALSHQAGTPSIFCFHDDNFLLPKPADSIERVTAMRKTLDRLGVGKAGFVGKCRPETLTPELARALRDLGVVRMYVGIENASQNGQDHLARRTRSEQLGRALDALNDAGVFCCYNLLVFEPEATLDDVRENLAFMRQHAANPVNFCRAEAYHGTPLHQRLSRANALGGSYLGWDYRITDDRTELLFRICSAVFRERNFASRGVANRYMGLGYTATLLDYFYESPSIEKVRLIDRARELTREVSLETAGFLEEAIELAEHADLSTSGRETVEVETARLALKIATHDRVWHVAFDELLADMRAFAAARPLQRCVQPMPSLLREAMSSLVMAGLLAVGVPACGGDVDDGPKVDSGVADAKHQVDGRDPPVVDPVPPDGGWYDPVPYDAGVKPDAKADAKVADAKPDIWVVDALPPDGGWYDPLPYDAGVKDSGSKDAGPDAKVNDAKDDKPVVVDPLPPDGGWFDPLPHYDPFPNDAVQGSGQGPQSSLTDHWKNTAPSRAERTQDLPLHQPPTIVLAAEWVEDSIHVRVVGGPSAMSIRWQTDAGAMDDADDHRELAWTPASEQDQLRVAVRTKGGVAVASVRPSECQRRG